MKPYVSIHMKRFSRKRFSQVMINKKIKQQLDELKIIISLGTKQTYDISYGDVILHLINEYKKSKQIESNVEEKLLVSVPLKQISLSFGNDINKKINVSYSLES